MQAGDVIILGRYPQRADPSAVPEPVEWLVLAADGDARMLIAKYGLIALPYNEGGDAATWETCSVRAWLNNEFYNGAFTDEEKGYDLHYDLQLKR